MQNKKGKYPSLIGTTHGSCRVDEAKRKITCKRCGKEVCSNEKYISVSIPGSMGRRNYCPECFGNILEQSQKDLDKWKVALSELRPGE